MDNRPLILPQWRGGYLGIRCIDEENQLQESNVAAAARALGDSTHVPTTDPA
ncbi:MAG: hypothetical protein R2911_15795 [Caldilineaceae bacterium]